MNYLEIETKEIKTLSEIEKEHNEIINSSYSDEDIEDIKELSDFIAKFYIEYNKKDNQDQEFDTWRDKQRGIF